MSELIESPVVQPSFWRLPLADRMALLLEIREQAPFVPVEFDNPMQGERSASTRSPATTRSSRSAAAPRTSARARGRCRSPTCPSRPSSSSGRSSTWTTPAMPDSGASWPGRSRPAAPGRARLGRDDLRRGDRRVVRAGRGRPGRGAVAAVPAARDLRHDGHPAQRVPHGARRHQRHPRRRRPRVHRRQRHRCRAMFEAGMQLTTLMNELAEERRRNPTDDLTSAARAQRPRRGHAGAPRDRAVLHPPGRRRQRHDPHRDQPRHAPAVAEPRPAPDLAGRPRGRDARGRGDRRGGLAGDVHASHRHPRRSPCPARTSTRATSSSCSTASPTATRGVRRPRALRRPARPEPPRRLRWPGPHFCLGAHLARRELSVVFRQLFTRLPDIEVAGGSCGT